MSPYLLLKTLHILTATLLFGTGLGSAYYAWRAWRSGQLQVIATTFRHLVSADWLFIATSAVFQPLSGLGLAYWAGWPLAQGWLLWSLGLYVFAGLCWLPVVWLQIRVRDLAEAATAAGTALPPQAFFYMRWWFALGWPAFLAFLAIFWLMVNKPL
ncbi:Uncharacterized membrane protein [Pseudomonas citronellolis]|uniref:Uncharacterized membrane protein n=1 Tax=Pseudomonas citronellolis TaxID=53408 RepID=A0AAQ1HMT4_9PSED|nr:MULTISPECIES: DUF2269 domain-containing protein [Pseudomonas]MCL6690535.1 DUF2269 domain-containing protein [Pseudomonas sp. R3.Fl]MCP1607889.1 putative membrane protein [Pseudomonas citronellolis]MCP1646507.1 putative membrane protein [Pseudomonas citronellolis]MCP1658676.1 putative membrane protein [Pseudomonas citronellolis]MCP1665139.1 putative membrane protein [Pseudomonas citronellolis]